MEGLSFSPVIVMTTGHKRFFSVKNTGGSTGFVWMAGKGGGLRGVMAQARPVRLAFPMPLKSCLHSQKGWPQQASVLHRSSLRSLLLI